MLIFDRISQKPEENEISQKDLDTWLLFASIQQIQPYDHKYLKS